MSTEFDFPSTLPIAASSSLTTSQDEDTHQELNHDTQAQSFQSTIQSLTDQALQFLSTASNETIGACLVGLGATTYMVLGRVGLVLMGVVGGVVLHATWEGTIHNAPGAIQAKAAEEKRRKEVALDVVQRALAWQSKKQAKAIDDGYPSKVEIISDNLNYDDYQPETSSALNELTDAVIRDYVK
jgi:hypothetical protein